MRRPLLLFALPLFLLLFFVTGLAGGQVAPGSPTFVPQDCHEVDCIDLLNNNITIHAPIRSKAGAMNFNSSLTGNFFEANPSGAPAAQIAR